MITVTQTWTHALQTSQLAPTDKSFKLMNIATLTFILKAGKTFVQYIHKEGFSKKKDTKKQVR